MTYVLAGIAALLAYLIGSISSSVIISKLVFNKDIREEGSGNAGATNMLRTYGKGFAALTLICDVLKGIIAVMLAELISRSVTGETNPFIIKYIVPSFKYIGGLFAVLGHIYPIFFSFHGGKGVATSLGIIMFLNWRVGLIVLIFALLIMICTRYVSLGSILAGIVYIAVDLSYMLFAGSGLFLPEMIFDILLAMLIIVKHKANIERLKNGTENKLGHKKEEA